MSTYEIANSGAPSGEIKRPELVASGRELGAVAAHMISGAPGSANAIIDKIPDFGQHAVEPESTPSKDEGAGDRLALIDHVPGFQRTVATVETSPQPIRYDGRGRPVYAASPTARAIGFGRYGLHKELDRKGDETGRLIPPPTHN